jgi:hypothetical protein
VTGTDPFRPCDLRIEFVDAVAGEGKTLTAVAVAIDRARQGVRTIFAMPTLELIREMADFARRQSNVPVTVLTSEDRESSVGGRIIKHVAEARSGLLFITHEAFARMGNDWPAQAREFELVIDEAIEVVLTRRPFLLRENGWALTSFLEIEPVVTDRRSQQVKKTTQEELQKLHRVVEALEKIIADGAARSSPGEVDEAEKQLPIWRARFEAAASATIDAEAPQAQPYYRVLVQDVAKARRARDLVEVDDVFRVLHPVPDWLLQGAPLFTDWQAWARMVAKSDRAPDRGRVSIAGFRRPDALVSFSRVTVMSALLKHTTLFAVWSELGVEFAPSELIRVSGLTTPLGKRTLRIYWIDEQGWSKRLRDQSGGIEAILQLIRNAGVIADEPVCVVTNKDDATETSPQRVLEYFPKAVLMPHNVRGQNRFRFYHQLIHTAAFNSFTADIRWIETALDIASREQRIARTGQEIYQSLMRLSLRDPRSPHDVSAVVMDRDVAEWLPQWFTPANQVEVIEIDASGVIRRKRSPGRPRIARPLTPAERMARYRLRLRSQRGDDTP